MDTYSGCLPRPNLDKIPQLCLLRKLTLHFSSMYVCHMNKVINRWSLSGKRMVVFCVLFCGKQQHEVKKFHLQKIVHFKKNLELLLEWAPDELVNQFAKKLETRNFRWHAFWKSQQEIPWNQSGACEYFNNNCQKELIFALCHKYKTLFHWRKDWINFVLFHGK